MFSRVFGMMSLIHNDTKTSFAFFFEENSKNENTTKATNPLHADYTRLVLKSEQYNYIS